MIDLNDFDDWWEDLTIEQRRAAYFAWIKADIKSVYIDGQANATEYIFNDSKIECPTCKRILEMQETPDHR
jgi:hypothetical protein